MTAEEIIPEVVEQLRTSEKLRGPIEKVVLSADGKLVDGHQRKAADPDWPEEINPHLKTEEDCILFSIAKNWNRTSKSENWKRSRIQRLATLGNSVQDIARKTGFKEWTVYNYYPDELKNQVKAAAGRVGGPAASVVRITTQLTEQKLKEAEEKAVAETIECANCHLAFPSIQAKYVEHKPYCPRCAPRIHVKKLNETKEERAVSPKSLDSAETKLARMHPHDSAFQERVINRFRDFLAKTGCHLEIDREFCVVSTIPDGYVPELDALVYVDGPPHLKGKQADTDERLRELLKKHHQELNIQGFKYKADSQKEEDRVFAELCKWALDLKEEKEPLYAENIKMKEDEGNGEE